MKEFNEVQPKSEVPKIVHPAQTFVKHLIWDTEAIQKIEQYLQEYPSIIQKARKDPNFEDEFNYDGSDEGYNDENVLLRSLIESFSKNIASISESQKRECYLFLLKKTYGCIDTEVQEEYGSDLENQTTTEKTFIERDPETESEWGEAEKNSRFSFTSVAAQYDLSKMWDIAQNVELQSKDIPLLLEAFEHVVPEFVTAQVTNVLKKIGATESAQELLERIRTNTHPGLEMSYARILYLLEDRVIPIDKQKLEYLGQKYVLQGQTDAVKAVRLTPDGKLGLLDEQGALVGYIYCGRFSSEHEFESEIMEITAEDLVMKKSDRTTEFEITKETFLTEYHQKFFQHKILQECGIVPNFLTLHEQFWLYTFLKKIKNTDRFSVIQKNIRTFQEPFLKLCVIMEFEPSGVEEVVDVIETLSEENAKKLLNAYHELLLSGAYQGEQMRQLHGKELHLTDHSFAAAFTVRAKEFLFRTKDALDRGNDESAVIQKQVEDIQRETLEHKFLAGEYAFVAEILRQQERGTIDLQEYSLQLANMSPHKKEIYLRVLQERGQLKPIPEIHWRVDRSNEEYIRRFGFDILSLLQNRATDTKQILLELGPGSGQSKAERAESPVMEHYIDIGLADTLYYPISRFIENSIDWETLKKRLPAEFVCTPAVQSIFCDALAKTLLISNGQTSQDTFTYAEDRIKRLTQNPEELKLILAEIAQEFLVTHTVPSTISTRDSHGTVQYTNKISLTDPALMEIKKIFCAEPKMFLRHHSGYEAVPAHPEGMLLGDFDSVQSIQSNSVDIAFGARSTVYKRDEEYVGFVLEMMRILKKGGIYFDDSIRDNDGWYYRLAEMAKIVKDLEVKQKEKFYTYIILGPGFEHEDYAKDNVPLAFVMGKETDVQTEIQHILQQDQGFRMVPFQEYIGQHREIAKLDTNAYTLNRLETTLVHLQETEAGA